MKSLLLLLVCLWGVKSEFCSARCASQTQADCNVGGTLLCTNYISTYLVNVATLQAGLTLVEYTQSSTMASVWTVNSLQAPLTCVVQYTFYPANFTFYFYNMMVGNDYIYRSLSITNPHYQVKFRFSIAYIGVWSTTNDFLWLHVEDGLQSYDYNLSYSCPLTTGGTGNICNMTLPSNSSNAYNNVDCLQTYDYTLNHNTTSLLLNLTYPNFERDPNIKFWALYDILIVTVSCHVACTRCYGALSTQCYSCASNYYYVQNNTCQLACNAGTFLLISTTNSLTGSCVTVCPQGYYPSGTSCLACPSGCLACTSASNCTVYSSIAGESLWKKYVVVWIILIIMFLILVAAIVYRLCCYKSTAAEQNQILSDPAKGNNYQQGTVHETLQPNEPYNFHIEQIDYKDNVLVDQQPRKRKRLDRDINRSSLA